MELHGAANRPISIIEEAFANTELAYSARPHTFVVTRKLCQVSGLMNLGL